MLLRTYTDVRVLMESIIICSCTDVSFGSTIFRVTSEKKPNKHETCVIIIIIYFIYSPSNPGLVPRSRVITNRQTFKRHKDAFKRNKYKVN